MTYYFHKKSLTLKKNDTFQIIRLKNAPFPHLHSCKYLKKKDITGYLVELLCYTCIHPLDAHLILGR